ncbi:MAG TPA: HEAT repeat domain-containing protein [Chloroflexota bacterium]|nr:HEAT repeat domain-containing protein [Chloroflexota bacterium]
MITDELLDRMLKSLGSGQTLAADDLSALSNLGPTELGVFRPVWDGLSTIDRRRLLAQLHSCERENLRCDFNAIYHIALDDLDAEVRRQALDSILEDESDWLLGKLLVMASGDPDANVREAAARQLAPFALKAELGELPGERVEMIERTLLAVVDCPGEAIGPRRAALASVGYLGNERVAAVIRRQLDDPELHQSAVRAMGRAADEMWLDALGGEARSKDPSLREEAARAFGEMADRGAVSLVVDMIDDPVLEVRLAAIAALGQIGGEKAREALIYALEDKRAVIREAAEAALVELDFEDDPLGM